MPVSLSTDLIIIVLFLIVTLIIGLWYGKGVASMQDYALGGRKFSTAALTATLIATWIGGSTFSIGLWEIYTYGILNIVVLGQVIGLFIYGYILAPRMQEFLGKLSVAEVMGDLYGKHVRIVTAICSIIMSITRVALQIKVFSSIFNYFFGIHSVYATVISSMIVIIYSAFGGIRAVVFTDIFQFLTFGAFIPTLALFIWSAFGSFEAVTHTLTTHPMFDPKVLLDYHNPVVLTYYGIFFYCLMPCFNPAMFQRVLIAQSTQQVTTSFKVSAITHLFFCLFVAFIGLVLLSVDSDMEANNLVMHIIDSYSYSGLKGLIVIGVIAMIMSTADSWINSASIIFVNDLCKPLGMLGDDEVTNLKVVRVFAMLIGLLALVMAISQQNLLGILLLGAGFYTPIVGIPLLITILGFRSSTRVILSGIISGVIATIAWNKYFEPSLPIGSIMPAAIVNFTVMMIVHYLLKEPGGWVGPKDRLPLDVMKIRRQDKIREVSKFFKLLKYKLTWEYVIHYCHNNSLLERQHYVFSILSSLSLAIMLIIDGIINSWLAVNLQMISFLMSISFMLAVALGLNKFWSREFYRKYIGLVWHIDVFYSLVFINTVLLLAGKVTQAPSIWFVLNLVGVGVLIRWYITLPMIMIGIPLGLWVFRIFDDHGFSYIVENHIRVIAIGIVVVIGWIMLKPSKIKKGYYKIKYGDRPIWKIEDGSKGVKDKDL